jgi:hypothetical protein
LAAFKSQCKMSLLCKLLIPCAICNIINVGKESRNGRHWRVFHKKIGYQWLLASCPNISPLQKQTATLTVQ